MQTINSKSIGYKKSKASKFTSDHDQNESKRSQQNPNSQLGEDFFDDR